ncbi:MAG: hypothetical protein AAB634_03480 [Patescibacteria group bacterium]
MLASILGSAFFVVQGVNMHDEAAKEGEAFHALQAEYYAQSKEARDAAPMGSELNQKLAAIQNAPSELMRIELAGIGKILIGIGALLLGILIALVALPGRVKDSIGYRD